MGRPVEGIQGKGLASVWSDGPDFWRFATMQRQDQARAQKALQDEKEARDAIVKENRQFAPGKIWEPFYGEEEDYIQKNIRDFTFDALNRGIPTGAVDAERTRRMGEARKLENKINYFRDIHKDMMDRVDEGVKGGMFKSGYYDSKINDFFFNGRQAKPSSQINPEGIENVLNDSNGYNMAAIGAGFMKDLPQQMTEKYRKISSDLGEQFDVSIIKSKLGTKANADGSVKLDPRTGLPEIEMTDDVTMLALENPYIRNFVMDNLGAESIEPNADLEPVKNLLAPILTPYDQRALQKQHRQGFKYSEGDKIGGSGYTVPEASVAERYDTLKRITHEYDPELLTALLPGLEDVNIGYEIYSPGEGKKAPPRIVVTYPNKKYSATMGPSATNQEFRKKTLSLETEEDRQSAMEFLNTVMDDKLPAKQKIGENFTIYRKKKRKEMEDAGGYYNQPAADDGAGGLYTVPKD